MRRQFTGLSMVPKQRTDISVVGEHSVRVEAERVTVRGLSGRANAGMSNERGVKNTSAVSPRVPGQG